MMSGRMSIFNILMSTSPGKDMNMITSSLGLAALPANPIIPPRITPNTVSTNNRFVFIQSKN